MGPLCSLAENYSPQARLCPVAENHPVVVEIEIEHKKFLHQRREKRLYKASLEHGFYLCFKIKGSPYIYIYIYILWW